MIFGALGLLLESLHGFKVRAYLDVTNETRRLMWTLAHAHGTVLGLGLLALAALGWAALVLTWGRAKGAATIVLVTVDTLRRDAVGAYGAAQPTPRMDALAARGIRFAGSPAHIPGQGTDDRRH